MFRAFLSHSDEDHCEAVALSDWLRESGWDDIVLVARSTPGAHPPEHRKHALQEDIAGCEATIFLISRNWLRSELRHCEFELARKLNKNIFCVLIENLPIADLPNSIKEARQTVSLASGEDFLTFSATAPGKDEKRRVAFSAQALDRLKTRLTKARLDPFFFAWPPEDEPDRAPYRGLQPLQAADAGIFFGRDEALLDALDALRGTAEAAPPRVFVILGAPGVGKSSFLRAGLWPRLARDDRHFSPLPVIEPGRGAVNGARGLAAAIASAVEERGLKTSPAQIREAIAGGADGLRPLLRDLAKPRAGLEDGATSPTLILAIDQAEGLFRPEGATEGQRLLTLLGDLARADDPAVIVLFAMRFDSYAALRRAEPFDKFRQHTFVLPSMPRDAYRSVIERPGERSAQAGRKFEIEPALTQALLEDVDQARGDSLPLLAFTLEQLFRACGLEKRTTRADYERFGRLATAIDAAVGRVLAIAGTDPSIPKDHEARLALLRRALIPWLAGVDPETGTARRRIARSDEIAPESRALIELLVEQRLVTRVACGVTGQLTFELAHDVLLRQWKLLKGWLAEETRLDATLDALKRASRNWEAHARSRDWAKHEGARLEEAERLHARPELLALLDSTDRAYLLACREKENAGGAAEGARRIAEAELERKKSKQSARPAQKARRLAWVYPIGLAAALAMAAVAGWRWQSAARQEREAQAQRDRAEKTLALATDATTRLMNDLTQKFRSAPGAQAPLIADIVTKASKLLEPLTIGDAHGDDLRRSQSVALNHIAETRLAVGDVSGALAAARRSAALMEALSASNPRDAGWRRDLSVSYEKLGDVQAAQGDSAGALKSYRDDLAIAKALSASDPLNAQRRWDLSVSYEKLGDIQLAQDDIEGALTSYRNDRDIKEALAASNAGNVAWQRDFAISYERLGATLAKRRDARGAIAAFEGALAIYQTLARANPDDPQIPVFSVVPHWRLAGLDRARAREHLEAALAILEPLSAADRLTEDRRGWIAAIKGELAALETAPAPEPPGGEPAKP